jgi:hypothetical protein
MLPKGVTCFYSRCYYIISRQTFNGIAIDKCKYIHEAFFMRYITKLSNEPINK